MKTIKVTDHAALFVETLRDENSLNERKAELCDVLCDIIAQADVNGTPNKELMPTLMAVGCVVDIINELSKEKDTEF